MNLYYLNQYRDINMDIYKKLKQIAEKEEKRSKGSDVHFFENNKNDLYEIDKDILKNETQKGDTYVWALKSNGCGTFLVRCAGNEESHTLKTAGPDSKFLLLQFTDANEGNVSEISYEQALNAYKDYPEPEGRMPRRELLYKQLNDMLGIKDRNMRLELSRMGSEFNPRNGDRSIIKISTKDPNWITLDVVRPKIRPPGKYETLIQKPREQYFAVKTLDAIEKLNLRGKQNKVLLVESQANGFAKISNVTERMFNIAINSIEKEKNAAQEQSASL